MKHLRVLSVKGMPGKVTDKKRYKDLINPDDEGCLVDDDVSIVVIYSGLLVTIDCEGTMTVTPNKVL